MVVLHCILIILGGLLMILAALGIILAFSCEEPLALLLALIIGATSALCCWGADACNIDNLEEEIVIVEKNEA